MPRKRTKPGPKKGEPTTETSAGLKFPNGATIRWTQAGLELSVPTPAGGEMVLELSPRGLSVLSRENIGSPFVNYIWSNTNGTNTGYTVNP